MCLSNVYKNERTDSALLFRNIADISMEGDGLRLTDIMGVQTALKAKIQKVDLLENYIIVEPLD